MPWKPYYHQIHIRFPFGRNQDVAWPLPVPPETLSFKNDQILQVYPLVALGETLGLGGKKLERLSWSSFFPRDYDSSLETITFAQHGLTPPQWWIDCFKQTQRRQTYMEVTINNTDVDGLRMAIESFQHRYVPGAPGDVWYELNLVEYKQGHLRRYRGTGYSFPRLRARPVPFGEAVENFEVTEELTLADVSIRVYGDESYWAEIRDANLDRLLPFLEANFGVVELYVEPTFSDPQAEFERRLDNVLDPRVFSNEWNQADPLPIGITLRLPPRTTTGQ